MQQLTTYSLLKETPRLLTRVIDRLFDDEPVDQDNHPRITLLNPQPLAQRQQFLQQAINHHYQVILQIVPTSPDGFPENVQAYVRPFGQHKYLLSNHNVTYVVGLNQIRYIAHCN